jgi:6-phosphogluconolactonase
MSEPKITVLDDAQAVYVHAAEEIAHFAGEDICTHAEFTIALSGGSTPAAVYQLLADRFRLSVDWKEVQFFWGDERCVPPDDELSNYAMANRTLLSHLSLRPEQVHRMRGELPPDEGARAYEDELKRAFSLGQGDLPRFGLVMLGLGDNRHTLSLFPGAKEALDEKEKLVVAVDVDATPPRRISFTPPVANNAERAMFIVTGAGKAAAVRDIIEGPRDPLKFPAQIIQPLDGELLWLLDKEAASLLKHG